jgi:hypothetical protein
MSSPTAAPLTATYTSISPPSTQTFTAPLSPPSSGSPSDLKTAQLSHLQTSLRGLQADINAFLTQKMADEKEDKRAEEGYGEEVVED